MDQARSEALEAVRRVLTNVAIVTTRDREGIHGLTANGWLEAVEPLVVLVTLNRRSDTYPRIKESGIFAVNFLAQEQEALAFRFASSRLTGEQRFEGVSYRSEDTGAPLLDGCVAALDCRVDGVYPFGRYDIVTGLVVRALPGPADRPLGYYDGHFTGIQPGGQMAPIEEAPREP